MGRGLRIIQAINIGLCLLGVLVFGTLLAYVLSSPDDFEQRSQSFIADQTEQELNERLSPAGADKMKLVAAKLSEKLAREIADVEAMVKAGTPKFIAAVIAAMCGFDCEQRAVLEAAVNQAFQDHLAHLNVGVNTLRGMVEEKYYAVLAELRRDITIFLGCNLAVMTLALAIAVFRGPAARHLLPIPAILTVSVLFAGYWYVFGQNWATAIVFSDYVGWSYLIFLGVVGVLLWDIAFNRARWMSQLLSSLPISVPILPC